MKKLLFILSLLILSQSVYAENLQVGVVSDYEGEVYFKSQNYEKKASPGMFVEKGMRIVTGNNSRVKIMMMDDSLLVIAPKTEFSIDEYVVEIDKKNRKSILGLVRGKVLFYINKAFSKPGSKFEVKSKTSVAGVRGTTFILESEETDFVAVLDGEVEVFSKDKNIVIGKGKCADSKSGFVLADLNKDLAEEYQNGFKISKGKTKVAMMSTGTRMSGEALVGHQIESGYGGVVKEVFSESIVKKSETGDGISESGIDSAGETKSPDDFNEIRDGDFNTDIINGGYLVLRVKILLPFVKLRR